MVLPDLTQVMGELVINWLKALLLTFSNIRNINTSGSVNEEVRGKPWYFGQISRSECDILMAEKGQDGDFLVRDSESTVSSFDLFQNYLIFNWFCRLVTFLSH